MTAFEVLSIVASGLGLIGGVVGVILARRASVVADAARIDAAAALVRSAAANEESAAALHRANELTEQQIPRPSVRWQVEPFTRSAYLVRNSGDATAYDAKLQGMEGVFVDEDSESAYLIPGDTLEFHVMRGGGMPRARITVKWRDSEDGEIREYSVAVTS